MDEMLLKVIDKLVEKTKAGHVEWEDVTSGFTGDRFRAMVDDVAVEVMDGERLSDRPGPMGGQVYRPYYRLLLKSRHGSNLTQAVQEEGEEHYRRLGRLLDVARESARRTGTVLQKLLMTLSK